MTLALPEAGARFGRLTFVGLAPKAHGRSERRARVQCDCGRVFDTRVTRLLAGGTKSCGCACRHRTPIHGHSKLGGHNGSPTFRTWMGIRRRCYQRSHSSYSRYGGRGITVCDRWRNSFEAFLADMGERPAGKTIDRIDPRGNYEPGNCRWATPDEQANNKTNNRRLTAFGETLTVAQWARRTRLPHALIRNRIDRGWSPERTLSTPRANTAPKGVAA